MSGRLKAVLRRADRALLDLVYPSGAVCLLCGRAAGGELLCPECQKGLDACALPDDAHAVWLYTEEAGRLVRMLKERAVAPAAEVLARGLAEKLVLTDVPLNAVITSVPMPVMRRRERGIDHGWAIAKALSERTGYPAKPLLKRKVRNAKTQRGLSAEERLRNMRDAFVSLEGIPQTVILVDDVLTTGATVTACAECLRAAGCRRVIVLVATRAEKDRKEDAHAETESVIPDANRPAADARQRGG